MLRSFGGLSTVAYEFSSLGGKPTSSGDNNPEVHLKNKSQQEQVRFVRKRKKYRKDLCKKRQMF